MNLPLQMRAVSRGFIAKSRVVRPVGGVVPSWLYVCDPPLVACGCSGSSGVACCSPNDCTCDKNGNPACLGYGTPPAAMPIQYPEGALGFCNDASAHPASYCIDATDITCYDAGDWPHTCGK
jgi:hypothetical protein